MKATTISSSDNYTQVVQAHMKTSHPARKTNIKETKTNIQM
jgi:hypothetical protein